LILIKKSKILSLQYPNLNRLTKLNINFDQQMPGTKGNKPDNDEAEMMKDIMGNDMM
jgi:hypothetical protein